MQKSARILGQEYGLTAEEMNRALLKLGFLEGKPGDYYLTDKAIGYAQEKDFHRGCGGYSYYNRYWTTRTFDDSIKDVLDISDELKKEVRSEVATARAARRAATMAAKIEADAAYRAKCATEEATRQAAEIAASRALKRGKILKTAGVVGVVVLVAFGIGYVIHKKWKEKRECEEQEQSEKE